MGFNHWRIKAGLKGGDGHNGGGGDEPNFFQFFPFLLRNCRFFVIFTCFLGPEGEAAIALAPPNMRQWIQGITDTARFILNEKQCLK